ncbi:MAG: hypothetical protein JWN66_1292 [Sphingomonas bacterium]|uniref:hypothetical protein n=1 Tax=Sphingomonas bacterium TaxID=1895847 RepID=UPI00261A4E4E|nr:hypothetical protein [Sphingomonas bacterium]MDB5704176.1 hypothetical protein [Sphingomonas bacterium]
MTHWTIGTWFSGALDLALLGCGLFYLVFGAKLRDRQDRRNAGLADGSLDHRKAKPPPDYFRLGIVLVIAGAGLTYLNFIR